MTRRIPTFPEFKPLEIDDRQEIELLTRRYPPYSDFNFVNLFCYDITGDCKISFLNGNLVVRFRDYVTLDPFYSFLGRNNVPETIEHLIAFSVEQGMLPALRLVPEVCIREAGLDSVDILEDPTSADYIIESANLVALESPRWHSKRKAASKFRRTYPHHVLKQLDLTCPQTQEQIMDLFNIWAERRRKGRHETQIEMTAIERILRHAHYFQLISLGAFIDGRLEGFTVNEIVHDNHYMGHFGKTNPDCTGLSVVLESETARIMATHGCTHMNYQQDLGLDGLKRYKHSWHPSAHLRKFILISSLVKNELNRHPARHIAHPLHTTK